MSQFQSTFFENHLINPPLKKIVHHVALIVHFLGLGVGVPLQRQ